MQSIHYALTVMRFVEFSKHHVSVTCSWLSRIKTNIYPLSRHVVHQPLRCIAFASFEQLVSRCLIGREQTIVLQMHFAFSKCRFMSPPSILPPYVRQPPFLVLLFRVSICCRIVSPLFILSQNLRYSPYVVFD